MMKTNGGVDSSKWKVIDTPQDLVGMEWNHFGVDTVRHISRWTMATRFHYRVVYPINGIAC
jgi:hypothetical protein